MQLVGPQADRMFEDLVDERPANVLKHSGTVRPGAGKFWYLRRLERSQSLVNFHPMSKLAALSSITSTGAAGFEELLGGVRNWRVWHLLGLNDLRHRYARSRFGQLWLTVSSGTKIS